MSDVGCTSFGLTTRSHSEILQVFFSRNNANFDCTITADGALTSAERQNGETANFTNSFLTEGLVDLQVNGFAGIDFNRHELTAAQLDFSLSEMARTGVTTFLPTVITGSANEMVRTLRSLDAAVSASHLGSLMVAGYHIEGPFLSPKDGYAGAHSSAYMTIANIELVDELQQVSSRPIRIMTVAPEVDGVIDLIPELVKRGIAVAIGHSAANLEQIEAAVKAGATLCTHLGNGLPQMLHKTDNPIFWQLAQDKLTAMFVADGIHVPIPTLQTMLRAKGPNRTILTTDAVSAACMQYKPGIYTLGKSAIEMSSDGTVRIPGSIYLAGSSVTMDQILRNIIGWYGYTIPQALEVTQLNPSQLLGAIPEYPSIGKPVRFVEWRQSEDGPRVARTHIGPFTIEKHNS
ncbi:MAG: N-acetylglucosamine-6-phosphate deacetylase [Blastopirellula sp.]|nr:MAG: N-acetylglucosamine-6-phosphate deacetylase [Blastopirellula sp.]